MRLTASLALALGGCGGALAAEDWRTWQVCTDAATAHPREKPELPNFPGILPYESQYQILTINADTGKIEMGRGDFWADIEAVTEPIKLIMTFGKSQKGKSVVASMLGCEMNKDNALQFPTFKGDENGVRSETQGIWASKPFSIPGDDTAKYMILDMASISNAKGFQRVPDGATLSSLRKEDELLKMLALMSEVVSTFVYNIGAAADISDWDVLGVAMGETRRNMVANSRNYEAGDDNDGAPRDQEVNLKSHNLPALIFSQLTANAADSLIKAETFEVDTAKLHLEAKKSIDILTADRGDGGGTLTLLERGFKLIKNGAEDIPFAFSPLPVINEQAVDNGDFNWADDTAYEYLKGAACDRYSRMESPRWQCKIAEGDSRVSNPSAYALMMKYLTDLIKAEAPVRRVSWKGQQYPTDLTGDRMKAVLETGIEEMNSIGPLPRTELWRKIMEDRCKSEVVEYLDFTFGERSGTYKLNPASGILYQIQEGLNRLSSGQVPTVDGMKTEWVVLQKKWEQKTESAEHLANFFNVHPLLKSVQEECTAEANEHQVLLEETWQTRAFEWTSILANKQRQIAQEKLREALQENWWQEFWREYQLYILGGALLGLIVLMILMRIWRGVNSTCRVCASCCGDWGDTTTTTKIITTHDGKTTSHSTTAVSAGPTAPFATATAVSATGVMPGSASEDPATRLEKLGKTIKELQKRASVDQ